MEKGQGRLLPGGSRHEASVRAGNTTVLGIKRLNSHMCVKPRRLGHRADLSQAVRADLDRRHRMGVSLLSL